MSALISLKANSVLSLDINVVISQACGIPIFLRGNGKCARVFITLYCVMCFLLFDIYYFYCEILDLFFIRNDIGVIAQNLCLSITHLAGVAKYLNILFKMRDIQAIIEQARELPFRFVIKEKHRRILKKSEWENKLILAVYVFIVIYTWGASFYSLLKDPAIGGRIFPFRSLLPDSLPLLVKIIYWVFGLIMLGIQIVAVDSINILLVNQVRCHLKILNISLGELTAARKTANESIDSIKQCIKHHQIVLKFRNDVERIFRFPILLQFIASLLVFVVTGFQAIVFSSSEGVVLIYCYCTGLFFQLFSYCWFANQVMEQNKLLVIAGYDTAWYEFGSRYSKLLLMFMVNAQKPLTFTAGGFFDLSLNAFSGMLTRSYSYIAVLRQVYA